MFPKLVKETSFISNNKKKSKAYLDDKGNSHFVSDLAKMVGIKTASMHYRIKKHGFKSPRIFDKAHTVPLAANYPKLVSETTVMQDRNRETKAYFDNHRNKHTVLDLANFANTSATTMRGRIKRWGFGSSKIFGLNVEKPEVNVYVPIIEGDLVGKFTRVRNDAETRELLDKIPSPGLFERNLL